MFSTLQLFVGLIGFSAVLVAFWMTSVILHRHSLERAAVILAAISGLVTAYLYVSMWGFTVTALRL
jgi:putative flippase GtrA